MAGAEQTHQAAHAASQLLGETIIHAAPITAKIHHEEHFRQLESWLEELETHTSQGITPFLTELLESTTIPESIAGIVREAIDTPAQFSAIVTQLFLYGIVSQLLSTSVQPFLQGISNDLWTKAVADEIAVPLSPAVIATAVARGLNRGDPPTTNVPGWAYTAAAMSGVDADDLNLQVSIVGTPPAPQELFELLRRGIISIDDVKRGLKEGDTRDDWVDYLIQLAHAWMTPTDFIRAAIQEQMTMADAELWAGKVGLDLSTPVPLQVGSSGIPQNMFGLGVAIGGRPPGPQEMAAMAHRGIINWQGTGADETTFQQGIAESDVKTKWTAALQALSEYVPAVGEIGTLLERGAITKDQAVTLWGYRGVPTYLAEGYAYVAEQQHIGQDKLLAIGEVKQLYFAGVLSKPDAIAALDDLGYRDGVASEILTLVDIRRELQTTNAVVRRVGTLYAAYKLTAANAQKALIKVGVDPGQVSVILQTWEALREEPIRLPAPREIGLAMKAGTIDQDQALAELASLGYQPRDAAIVLSAHSTARITPLPPAGASITG